MAKNGLHGSQIGVSSVDDVLKNTSADDIRLEGGAKYLIDSNLKILQQSIQMISRFSDQLHIEPSIDSLSIKAINSSKSAFASIKFNRQFFSEVDVSKLNASESNLCRISMRSALAIFGRGNGYSENRTQLSCKLQIDSKADYLIAQMIYSYSVTKCFVIPLRDCVVTYKHLFNDKSKLRNQLTIPPRTLLAILTQIGSDLDEVKIVAASDFFCFERFFTTEEDKNRVRKTAASIDLDCFERYYLQYPTEIAVNMKELKAVLHFADITGMSVNLHFDQPGRPIIVALEENIDFVAEFVLATFEETYKQFQEDINDVEEMIMISQNQKERKNEVSESLVSEKIIQQSFNEYKSIEETNLGAFEPINKTFIDNSQNSNLDDIQIVMVSQNLQLHENENIMNSINPTINNQIINNDLEIELQMNNDINFQNNYDQINMLNNSSVNNVNQPNVSYHDNENCVDKSFTTLVMEQMSKTCFNDNKKDTDEFNLIIPNFSQPENDIIEKKISISNNFSQSHSIEKQENDKSSKKEFEQIISSEESNKLNITKEVIIDDDIEYEFSDWNPNRSRIGSGGDSIENNLLHNLKVVNENEITIESNNCIETRKDGSPIYDLNLSCSPSVYLNGDRPFNIRLTTAELKHLEELNQESETQHQQNDQHENDPSTSFVGRLLDEAVKRTKPDSSINICESSTSFNKIINKKNIVDNIWQNNDTIDKNENLAKGSNVSKLFITPKKSTQTFTEDLSPNPYDLNRLANAVEQLKSKFGGFKERPGTQKFSQERADLALESNLNFFNGNFIENTRKSFTPKINKTKSIANNIEQAENISKTKNIVENLCIDQNNDDDIVVITTRTSAQLKPPKASRSFITISNDSELDNSLFDDSNFRDEDFIGSSCSDDNVNRHVEKENQQVRTAEITKKTADSSKSSVILEEDFGCEGGWLRKPNTQRNSQYRVVPFKSSSSGSASRRSTRLIKKSKNFDGTEFDLSKETNRRSRTNDWRSKPSLQRPLRKRPTLADELNRRMSPPQKISPPAVIVLTSPTKNPNLNASKTRQHR